MQVNKTVCIFKSPKWFSLLYMNVNVSLHLQLREGTCFYEDNITNSPSKGTQT